MALQNKLGITDSAELARIEEKISKKKAVELFESDELKKYRAGTFEMLAFIHRYLFSEIYDFARKNERGQSCKRQFPFCTGHVSEGSS